MSLNVTNSYHHHSLHFVLNICCLIQIPQSSSTVDQVRTFQRKKPSLSMGDKHLPTAVTLARHPLLNTASSSMVVFLLLYHQRKKFNRDCIEPLPSLIESYSSKQENMDDSCHTEMPLRDRLGLIWETQSTPTAIRKSI